MLLTAKQRRRRNAAMKWGALTILAALILAPKIDMATTPNLSFPLVTAAVAGE